MMSRLTDSSLGVKKRKAPLIFGLRTDVEGRGSRVASTECRHTGISTRAVYWLYPQ
jgi:hypothetical protein